MPSYYLIKKWLIHLPSDLALKTSEICPESAFLFWGGIRWSLLPSENHKNPLMAENNFKHTHALKTGSRDSSVGIATG
jgi:hypothetical protein